MQLCGFRPETCPAGMNTGDGGGLQLQVDVGIGPAALPPTADIRQRIEHVCFVPEADIRVRIETRLRAAWLAKAWLANQSAAASVQLNRDLFDLSCKREGHLVIIIIHGCTGVRTNIEGLAQGHKEWNGVWDLVACDFRAVHLEHARASLAETWLVGLEVEHDGVLAGC